MSAPSAGSCSRESALRFIVCLPVLCSGLFQAWRRLLLGTGHPFAMLLCGGRCFLEKGSLPSCCKNFGIAECSSCCRDPARHLHGGHSAQAPPPVAQHLPLWKQLSPALAESISPLTHPSLAPPRGTAAVSPWHKEFPRLAAAEALPARSHSQCPGDFCPSDKERRMKAVRIKPKVLEVWWLSSVPQGQM